MKRFSILIAAIMCMCLVLSGCVYSSANLMRAQGKEVNVLGAWGWVKCVDASVTMYRSTDAIAYPKDPKTAYPKIPARPNYQAESEAESVNIGKTTKLTPKADTVESDSTPTIAAVAQAVMTK